VQNFPEGGNLLIAYPKSVEGIQERMSVKPDSLGYFEARIPVINSVNSYFFKISWMMINNRPNNIINQIFRFITFNI
jgi:hypothetical protein